MSPFDKTQGDISIGIVSLPLYPLATVFNTYSHKSIKSIYIVGFILLWLMVLVSNGQNFSNFRSKKIWITPSTAVRLDSLSIAPHSEIVMLHGKYLSKGYRIEYGQSMFYWLGLPDSILVSFRVLPDVFTKKYEHKDRKKIEKENLAFGDPFEYTPAAANGGLFDKQGLDMRGSVSRGIGFGNTQDLVVNSNLNLQISGKLNNDVEVLAAVSDDNNPIQPEGNTQQLQDFDRVFIQFAKNKTRLTLGDFQMLKPEGTYFMNYNKKSRGMAFVTGQQVSKKWSYKATGDMAMSRGRFSRNTIQGLEGNQGPYRLKGVNGEIFIIIISGTEVIYLDGEKMDRGEQNDYTINYNTGEVTFMPKHLITAYSRIVMEFQYSDRNYARSVFTAGNQWEYNSIIKFRVNYFTESDNKNQPFQRPLSDSDKHVLSLAGNDPTKAVIPSETRLENFDKSKILYRKIDSLVGGFPYPIYIYTADASSDSVFYTLGFSYIGEGGGNYIIASSSANGRVYKWVAPQNGLKQGSYEPQTQLIAPNRMQMLTFGTDWQIDSNTLLNVEMAHSDFDRNTFSDIGNNQNGGWGVKAKLANIYKINKKKGWTLKSMASYEQVDEGFRYVERYRPVEFERQWNRKLTNETKKDTGYNEQIGNASLELRKTDKMLFAYGLSYYDRNRLLTGLTHSAGGFLRNKKAALEYSGQYNFLQPKTSGLTATNFYAYKIFPSFQIKSQRLFVSIEEEQSSFKLPGKDTLLLGSYGFRQFGGGISSGDTAKLSYQLSYLRRNDRLPQGEAYSFASISDNINLTLQHIDKKGNHLRINGSWRNFETDGKLNSQKPEKTILLRFEYDLNLLKRMVTLNTFYQIGTGQELKRQFSYLEVQPGLGIYQWNDYNKDSIQQLNEFELAVFKDKAKYIRVYLPTTEYVRSNNLQFNQSLQWNPGNRWQKKGKFLKFVGRFTDVAIFRIDRKNYALQNQLSLANPFESGFSDTSLVSLNSLVRNIIFFNRADPVWGIDFNWQNNSTKQLLTNGIDSRLRVEREINFRYTFNRSYILKITGGNGTRAFHSAYFTQNNFEYTFWNWKPSIDFQKGTKFRLSVFYNGFIATNHLGIEKTRNNEVGSELRYGFKENGTLTARYSFNHIEYTGDNGTPVSFDMLQGLLDGNNQTWNIQIMHRISSNIQINFNYDGRKTATSKVVHIARAEARYLF